MRISALSLTLPLLGLLLVSLPARAQTTVRNNDEHVYGANLGWINARADELPANGLRVSENVCSGYIYSANVGWIHLGDGTPTNNIAYLNNSATDYGVNNVGDGRLDGFAYGANIGWIKFDKGASYSRPRYNLLTGKLSGYAYGANVGWINLGETSADIDATLETVAKAPDTDADGIADFWELQKSGLTIGGGGLNVYTATSDTDKDGQADLHEYVQDTNPNQRNSALAIISYVPLSNYATVDLTFTSTATRVYQVVTNTDLGSYINLGAPFLGDTLDGDTLVNVPVTAGQPNRFWKINATRPLVVP